MKIKHLKRRMCILICIDIFMVFTYEEVRLAIFKKPGRVGLSQLENILC